MPQAAPSAQLEVVEQVASHVMTPVAPLPMVRQSRVVQSLFAPHAALVPQFGEHAGGWQLLAAQTREPQHFSAAPHMAPLARHMTPPRRERPWQSMT